MFYRVKINESRSLTFYLTLLYVQFGIQKLFFKNQSIAMPNFREAMFDGIVQLKEVSKRKVECDRYVAFSLFNIFLHYQGNTASVSLWFGQSRATHPLPWGWHCDLCFENQRTHFPGTSFRLFLGQYLSHAELLRPQTLLESRRERASLLLLAVKI